MGGVGPVDRIVEIAVGHDREGWSELLLVDDAGAVGETGQDRGLEEVAGTVHGLAAGDGGGT